MRRLASCLFAPVILVAALLVFASSPPAQAETGGAWQPLPPWVDDLPGIEALAAEPAPDAPGIRYLLRDQQFAWPETMVETGAGAGRAVWQREVMALPDQAAVHEAGIRVFEYNAGREAFALTRIALWRGGEMRELTGAPEVVVQIVEEAEETGGLSQQRVVVIEIAGLQPGDILDLSTLRRSDGEMPGLEREAVAPLEYSEPALLSRVVVNWPAGWGVFHPDLSGGITLADGPLPVGGTRYDYQLIGQQMPVPETLVPVWADQLATLRLTAERDWQPVVAELAPHYSTAWPLGIWQARLDGVRPKSGPVTGETVMAALHMVQGEIDSITVPFLSGPWLVRRPAEVAASGYGSPLEKALLLRTMLTGLGLKADVALTSGTAGPVLDSLPPSVTLFDGAVVRLEFGGRVWWLDPSAQMQAVALEHLTPLRAGYALPLRKGVTEPEALGSDPAAIWTTDVRESWRMTPAGAYLDVISDHRGEAADDLRDRAASWGMADIAAELHDYYQLTFPGIVMIREPDFEEIAGTGQIRMHERYFLPARALDLQDFPLAAEDFTSDLPQTGDSAPPLARRKFPMAGIEPGLYRHRVELRGRFGRLIPPQPVTLENPAFRYSLRASAPEDGRVVLDWEFFSAGAAIAPGDVAQVLEDARKVYDTTWFSYDLD